MRKSIFLIILLFSSSSFSQSKLDSLESAYEQASTDSTRIILLHQLSDEYSYEIPSKAKDLLLQAIELSESTNIPILAAEGLNKLGTFLSLRASYDSAIQTFEKALKVAGKAEFNIGYSEALIGIGDVFWRKGELKKAQEYQEKNIAFSESIDNLDGIASSYNTLGNINNDIGEFTKAMEYYTLAAEMFRKIGNQRKTSIALTNVGVIHQKLENYEKAILYYLASDSIFRELKFHRGNAFIASRLSTVYKNMKQYERSLSYSEKALESFEKLGGRSDIAEIKHNMGNLYWEQGKYSEALPYYLEARAINLDIGDSMAVAMNSQSVGGTYFELGDSDNALNYLNEALTIAKIKGAKLTIMDSYETLSAVYSDQQNFKNAYENLSQFIKLRDSLYTIEKRDLASEIEAKYQNEAQQRTIELQEVTIAKRQNERNGLIIIAIIILIILALIINQYRIKQKTNRQLRELDQIKSTFFENISHEFRTPLSLILAPIKDRMNQPLTEEDEQLFQTVVKNAENLDDLIKQLLDLAKIEKGKYDLQSEPVEASGLCKVIAASYESLAAVKKITFDVKVPAEERWFQLDIDLVKKICNNLLSNAFKFTPSEGHVRFEIEYDSMLMITVSDTGPGIPKKEKERIFDRFYQVEGPHATGTGIGLALTKELVEAAGGNIELDSDSGKGTSFKISLPIKTAESGRVADAEIISELKSSENEYLQTFSDEKQNLLIIEDNEDLRSYLQEIFMDEFNVQTAINGKEGIEVAKESIPDLIISDIMMEEMDGLEVCESLKSNLETDHIPIVLLTARADQQTKLEGLKLGADAYVLKPFESVELKAICINLINQREKLRVKFAQTFINENERTTTSHPFTDKCLSIIKDHLSNESLSVDDFAREVGMSRMQVHRKLKAMTGFSTTAFIRHSRLIEAKALLESGEPVSQVAYAVGFSSLAYFSKTFKEEFGIVPSQVSKKQVRLQ